MAGVFLYFINKYGKIASSIERRDFMAQSLYIHIPFCDQICSYCDFPKVFSAGQDTDAYLDALLQELAIYNDRFGFKELQTVYIGGGTPSVLTTRQLDRLFNYLHTVIDFSGLTEVSIEANPESLNARNKIACLKKHGVTRVSLGVQTFHERHLRILERSHSAEDARAVIQMLAEHGFEINVDMIYGIPSQTLQDWEADLDTLLALPITHVSAYSLILEEHTKFYIDYIKDQLELVANEVEADMFETVIDKLTAAGFEHYEISNFTRSKRSDHNLTYWKNDHYIGVGLGAHGQAKRWLSDESQRASPTVTAMRVRYENTRSITAYKASLTEGKLPILAQHEVSKDETMEETMFLGLRLLEGIQISNSQQRLYKEKIEKLINFDYVTFDALHQNLRLTRKGLLMANVVFEEFLLT